MKECSGQIAATSGALLKLPVCSSASFSNQCLNPSHLHKTILPRLVRYGENFGYKQHEVIAMPFKHVPWWGLKFKLFC